MKSRLLIIAQVILLGLIGNTVIAGATPNQPRFTGELRPPSSAAQVSRSAAQAQPLSPEGTGFTYQGSLKIGGSPANGQYDFIFTLFDAAAGGNQVGSQLSIANQTVTNGLFTVQLDFGGSAFQGDARWLEIAVRQSGGGTYTTLSPRLPVTPTSYATSLVPGAVISGTVSRALSATSSGNTGTGIYGESTGPNGSGVEGVANNGSGALGVLGASNNGIGVKGTSSSNLGGLFSSSSGNGAEGLSTAANGRGLVGQADNPGAIGVLGTSNSGTGVYAASGGQYGLYAYANGTNGYGVYGQSGSGASAAGVAGISTNGYGGQFASTSGIGVKGTSSSNLGGLFSSSSGNGAEGLSTATNGEGLVGQADTGTNSIGVLGTSNSGTGVYAASGGQYGLYAYANGTNGYGVYGQALNGVTAAGVAGLSASGYGGSFTSTSGTGIKATSNNTAGSFISSSGDAIDASGYFYGVSAFADPTIGAAIYSNGYIGIHAVTPNGVGEAGQFDGNVVVNGNCCASGESMTRIDDPTDPANKYLNQSVVASPDMLEIYRGHVTLDANGSATAQLPSYFQALNRDFDYQLTPVGAPMPDLYVAQEIAGNSFVIAGGKPGAKVSWQVTGVRQDPYALAHPIQPEQDKPAGQQGKYLYPKELGQPESQGVDYEKSRPQPPVAQPTQQPNPPGH